MRRLPAIALAMLVAAALVLAGRDAGPRSDAARAQHLSEQLRCPVCDGLAVADSPSSTARAIAADVRTRIAAGETDDEIRRTYVAQYGQWILLEPPATGIGVAVWLLPAAGLVSALGGGAWVLRRRSGRSAAPPSDAARALVAQARDEETAQ